MKPSDLPDVARARLPQSYESARDALAVCNRIDECADWANKAEALASYARQAKDDSLRKQADRIQARAIRRCGQLLKQYDGRGDHWKSKSTGAGTSSQTSRAEAGTKAGMSKRQQDTAVRVASIERDFFESQVESDNPPTITELAEQGTKKQPRNVIDLEGCDPEDFQAAAQAVGWIRQVCSIIEEEQLTTDKVLRGFLPHDKGLGQFRVDLANLSNWIETLRASLRR